MTLDSKEVIPLVVCPDTASEEEGAAETENEEPAVEIEKASTQKEAQVKVTTGRKHAVDENGGETDKETLPLLVAEETRKEAKSIQVQLSHSLDSDGSKVNERLDEDDVEKPPPVLEKSLDNKANIENESKDCKKGKIPSETVSPSEPSVEDTNTAKATTPSEPEVDTAENPKAKKETSQTSPEVGVKDKGETTPRMLFPPKVYDESEHEEQESSSIRQSLERMRSSSVFFKDDTHGWLPGNLIDRDEEKGIATVLFKDRDGKDTEKEMKIKLDSKSSSQSILLQCVDDSGSTVIVQDLRDLPNLNEASILYNLKNRYQNRKCPYTRATSNVLVAINPYHWIDGLYSHERRNEYSEKIVWKNELTLPPHLYETSAMALKGILTDEVDQTIVVSGESGSGKFINESAIRNSAIRHINMQFFLMIFFRKNYFVENFNGASSNIS